MIRLILIFSLATLAVESIHGGEFENLLKVEAVFIRRFESYMAKVEQEREAMEKYLEKVSALHEDAEGTANYFGNPLNAFKMMNRFANNWRYEILDKLVGNETSSQYEKRLANELKKKNLKQPNDEDLLMATEDLRGMQEMENLSAAELASAVVFADEVEGENVTLSASDSYVIGQDLLELEHHQHAVEWLMQARALSFREVPSFPNVPQVRILELLAQALLQLGNRKLANKMYNEVLKLDPKNELAVHNKEYLQEELALERIAVSKLMAEPQLDDARPNKRIEKCFE